MYTIFGQKPSIRCAGEVKTCSWLCGTAELDKYVHYINVQGDECETPAVMGEGGGGKPHYSTCLGNI